jgi:hypothetical protein
MTAIGGIGASVPGARSDGATATGPGVELRAVIRTGVVGVLVLAGVFVALGFLITGPSRGGSSGSGRPMATS